MRVDIRRRLRKFVPHLLKAQEENLNEADTCQRLVKFFEEILDYDALTEITREQQVKGKYVDFAIKIDGTTRFLVEAKAAGTVLRDRHIEQAERYASEANIRWVLLTNGVAWALYHLSFEEGIEYEKAFAVDLSNDPNEKAAEVLALLHRKAVKGGALDEYWTTRVTLRPASIGKALMTEDVLRFLRREIRKQGGLLVDIEDLANSIHEMFTPEAREEIGPVRLRRKRRAVRKEKSRGDTVPCESMGEPGQGDI